MRSILIGIVLLSTSIVVGHPANAQGGAQDEPGYDQAPVGHRQPTRNDVQGDDQSDESGLAKEIDKENRQLDQELKGICRGC
jgi:hypothetical protein